MTSRYDLHVHTSASDGSMTPCEVIDAAVKEGLDGLSITDHDTLDGYKEAVPYAKKRGVLLGTGVEFSCVYQETSVHVLGYDLPLEDISIQAYCDRLQKRRCERNKEIISQLANKGMHVSEDLLMQLHPNASTLGRPHIALALERQGYVQTMQEAFDRYLGDGACCYVPGEPFFVQEALELIATVGGKSFLAHPHQLPSRRFVEQLLSLGFHGIEGYYGRLSAHRENRWVYLARKRGLLVSGGSDFHGSLKPHISLGCSYVTREIFEKIFQRYR